MCEHEVHIDLAMLIYYCKTINYYESYLKELGDSTQLKTLIQNVVFIFIRQFSIRYKYIIVYRYPLLCISFVCNSFMIFFFWEKIWLTFSRCRFTSTSHLNHSKDKKNSTIIMNLFIVKTRFFVSGEGGIYYEGISKEIR